MAEERNNNVFYKCPHCTCTFLTKADLQKHISQFGNAKEEHEFSYRRIHGRLEHGYGEE
ncbi:MAG: hypothetical protein ABSA75_10810 [Candidatus Bathyarchaeia archaeon]|jgi:uncharacterized C2H2 Zn-finger protein